MQLRDYQTKAVAAIGRCLSESGSTMLVLATGAGKTVVLAQVIKEHCPSDKRAMVLAHREELIHQNARTIERVLGEPCDIERADQHADLPGALGGKARVIVASKDSLHKKRLERFDPSEFGLLVCDEFHHGVADSYRRIFDYFGGVPLLGVTATPDRLDEEALGQVVDSVAMVYEIADAIRDGWLVPVKAHTVAVLSLDISNVGTVAGDLNQTELARQLEIEQTAHEICASITKEAGTRRALVFTVSVRGAQQLADILNDYKPGCARMVCGETDSDKRAAILAAHKRDEFQFLTNVGIATEGYDDPAIGLIVMARPTKSRALFAQMLGRGTRPLPGVVDDADDSPEHRRAAIAASAKQDVRCMDFTGNCGKHKLVTPADVLGGKYSDSDRARAAKILEDEGGDVSEALERAKRERERAPKADPMDAEYNAARVRIVAAARYLLTPQDLFDGAFTPGRERVQLTGKRPTDKQIETLAKHGFKADDVARMSRSECSRLIGEIVGRIHRGLCTCKQAAALQRRGVKDAENLSFEDARMRLDRLYGARV